MSQDQENYLDPYYAKKKVAEDPFSEKVVFQQLKGFDVIKEATRLAIRDGSPKIGIDIYKGVHPGIIIHAEKISIGSMGEDSGILADAVAKSRVTNDVAEIIRVFVAPVGHPVCIGFGKPKGPEDRAAIEQFPRFYTIEQLAEPDFSTWAGNPCTVDVRDARFGMYGLFLGPSNASSPMAPQAENPYKKGTDAQKNWKFQPLHLTPPAPTGTVGDEGVDLGGTFSGKITAGQISGGKYSDFKVIPGKKFSYREIIKTTKKGKKGKALPRAAILAYPAKPDSPLANGIYLNNNLSQGKKRTQIDFCVIHDGGYAWRPGGHGVWYCALDALFHQWGHGTTSSHYLIDKDGRIYQMKPERVSAFHAGAPSEWPKIWRPVSRINTRSIGIDLQRSAPGQKSLAEVKKMSHKDRIKHFDELKSITTAITRKNYRKMTNEVKNPYSPATMASLRGLLQDISKRLGLVLSDATILAHFELTRKPEYRNDPDPGFEWKSLPGIKYDHRERNHPVFSKRPNPVSGLISDTTFKKKGKA